MKIANWRLPVSIAAYAAVAAVGGVLVGTGPAAGTAVAVERLAVHGVVALIGADNVSSVSAGSGAVGTACTSYGLGFADIRQGAQVTVYGSNGNVIGAGTLGDGIYDSDNYSCMFGWSVPGGIKLSEGPFQYEVTHRGRISFTVAEAVDGLGGSLGH